LPREAPQKNNETLLERKGAQVMPQVNSVVAIYETHAQAEEAVKELQRSGFDMKKMSIVGKDYHSDEHVVGYYNTGDRMKYWGKLGAFWGGIWGLFFGAAFFAIPGIGPVLVAGPLVAWIVGALEGAVVVGGLSALGAGLYSIGIPKNSVVKYELALKSDKFLVLAHGTTDEVAKAKDIMQSTRPVEVGLHAAERTQHAGASAR
jgi:Heat induced stress protein YflT domain